jgi:hypothetical protein
MGAGPVPEILHRLLIGLSWLARWKIVPSLTPIAGLGHRAIAFAAEKFGLEPSVPRHFGASNSLDAGDRKRCWWKGSAPWNSAWALSSKERS